MLNMLPSLLIALGSLSLISEALPLEYSITLPPKRLAKRWYTPSTTPLSVAGLTVTNGNETINYYSVFESWSETLSASFPSEVDGWYPITVFSVNGSVSCASLSSLVDSYGQTDDVFNAAFLSGIVLASTAPVTAASGLEGCFSDVTFVASAGGGAGNGYTYLTGSPIPSGPYLAEVTGSNITLYRVWRAYNDEQQAFTAAIVPLNDNPVTFQHISVAANQGMNTIAVGVPSRLYYTPTADQPLAGARIAVKDIFDIAGTRRGCGSRAYYNFYPPRATNCVLVQRLIDLGAVIVGKTKASQFANGETPTADWVDQMCPFNPRGDGYNDPSSSSSGSGAGMGAYDWLDFAIGSDTGGSIRGPAGQQGIYGSRPTFDAISLDGVMPLSDVMDTGGGFARDPLSFQLFLKALYGDKFQEYNTFPTKIRVPSDEFDDVGVNASQPLFDNFVSQIASFLNATVDNTTAAELWNQTGYGPQYGDLDTYMNLTYPTLIGYYQYTNFSQPWIEAYQAENNGSVPFIDPNPLVRWQFGNDTGAAGYAQALTEKSVFQNFTNNHLVPPSNTTCSEYIYLYPQSNGGASPRNVYFNAPTYPYGYGSGRIGPFSGAVDTVVPFGEVEQPSTITNTSQILPVTMSFVAHPGCDYMLLNLFVAMSNAGLLTAVKTGVTSY